MNSSLPLVDRRQFLAAGRRGGPGPGNRRARAIAQAKNRCWHLRGRVFAAPHDCRRQARSARLRSVLQGEFRRRRDRVLDGPVRRQGQGPRLPGRDAQEERRRGREGAAHHVRHRWRRLGRPRRSGAQEGGGELHYPWVEAAKRMGCHSIRVNAPVERRARGAGRSSPPTGCGSSPSSPRRTRSTSSSRTTAGCRPTARGWPGS